MSDRTCISSLPYELIHHILSSSTLSSSDLLSTSVLSSSFRHPSQSILHSSLSFSTQHQARSWLLSPLSGQFTCYRLMVVGKRRSMRSIPLVGGFGDAEKEGLGIDVLRAVLKVVRGVKELEVHCMDDWNPSFLTWTALKNVTSLVLATDFLPPSRTFTPYFRLTSLSLPLSFPISLLPSLLPTQAQSLRFLSISSYSLQQLSNYLTYMPTEVDLSNIKYLVLDLTNHPANEKENFEILFGRLSGVKDIEVRGHCTLGLAQTIAGALREKRKGGVEIRFGQMEMEMDAQVQAEQSGKSQVAEV